MSEPLPFDTLEEAERWLPHPSTQNHPWLTLFGAPFPRSALYSWSETIWKQSSRACAVSTLPRRSAGIQSHTIVGKPKSQGGSMLILTRKAGEVITVGDDIQAQVLEIRGKQVRLGIAAPRKYAIHRLEVLERIRAGIPKSTR